MYISPSSFLEYQRCEHKFYLKRQSQHPYPEYDQSMPAAIGTVIDCLLKADVAKALGMQDDPKLQLPNLLKDSLQSTDPDTVIAASKAIYSDYKRMGGVQKFIDLGIVDLELNRKVTLEHNGKSVPIYGKPDFFLEGGVPVDLKCQGTASKSGASPAPGYVRGLRLGQTLGKHKRCGEPLESINKEWATQMTIYDWSYNGIDLSTNGRAIIENITCRSGKTTTTTIDTHITKEFRRELWGNLCTMYEKVMEGYYKTPIPDASKCYAYRSLCECSPNCEAFDRWQSGEVNDNDVMISMLGKKD